MTDNTASAKRGDNMEFMAALVFQAQGYLVRRSVPLQYGASGQDASDIDVLGTKFSEPFQLHRILCDCKDRQKSRPYERIFWARGLSSFVSNASETYVCLPKANIEIIKFAKSGQVRVLTEDALRHAAGSFVPFGFASPKLVEVLKPLISTGAKADKEAGSVFVRTRRLYLADDPYVAFNKLMIFVLMAAEKLRKQGALAKERYELWRVIAGECLVLMPLLLLGMASDTVGLNPEQRRKHILERLTYGDLPPRKAEELFGLAKEAAKEASRATNPKLPLNAPLPFDLGNVEPPEYAEDVIGLVERAVAQPGTYISLPQIMDYLVFQHAFMNGGFREESYLELFPHPLQQDRLKAARNIFVFARDRGYIPLQAFWPKEESNLPRLANHVAAS